MIEQFPEMATRDAHRFKQQSNIHDSSKLWKLLGDSKAKRISLIKSQQFDKTHGQTKAGELSMVKKIFEQIEGHLTLLDIGCRSGYYFEVINDFFPGKYKYAGCDYNPKSVTLAKQYYPNIHFFIDDLTQSTVANQQFDITFLSGVIEHIPNFQAAISELCRITKTYIILHRIIIPKIKIVFFSLFKNQFEVTWTSPRFDGSYSSHILKRKVTVN